MTQTAALTLDGDTERFLAWASRAGDRAAREELVRSGIRWVHMHAARLGHFGARRDEAVAAGMEGLLRAVDRFDPRYGTRLVTFAWPWIARAMNVSPTETVPLEGDVGDAPPEPESVIDASVFQQLPHVEAEILRLRYGFADGECWSRRSVAAYLKLTESQVRTKETKAIVTLQRMLGRVSQRAPQ